MLTNLPATYTLVVTQLSIRSFTAALTLGFTRFERCYVDCMLSCSGAVNTGLILSTYKH